MSARVIFHIDINAFYASVEAILNPEIRDKPIVVCSNRRGSVVTTANYIARSFGIRSAMPLSEALKLCPDVVVTGVHFDEYERVSRLFMNLMKKYSSKMEIASIDECYLDMSDEIARYKRPLDLAMKMKKDISDTLGLTVSIGIAPNRFLAKMASDYKKPDAITVMRKIEVRSKLWPLSIDKMHGIGIKSAALCKQQGIFTIGDLANAQLERLTPIFKNHAWTMKQRAIGEDDSDLMLDSSAKSLSQSTTLSNATEDYDEICSVLFGLSVELANRLKEEDVLATSVQCIVKDENFQTYNRSKRLEWPSDDADEFYQTVLMLFDEHFFNLSVKLLGVGCSSFVRQQHRVQQLSLFEVQL